MKKSFNVLLLFVFAMSLTVWSCKPKQVISETAEQEAVEEIEEVIREAEEEAEATQEAMQEEVMEEVEVGETCGYNPIEGKAIIRKLNLSNPNEVIIKFSFEPNDKAVSGFPEVSNDDIVFSIHGHKKYPSLDWCKKNGIEKGASFDCARYEVAEKEDEACEKVYFSLTAFEDSGL
jgi:hypothetical protein